VVAALAMAPSATAVPAAAPSPSPAPSATAYRPSLAAAPTDHPSYYSLACQVKQSAGSTHPCTFGATKHPVLTVALVGDSVAGEWLAAVNIVAEQRNWKIVTDLHSRCPWTATMTINLGSSAPYSSCHTWGRAVLRDLLDRIHPNVVITSNRPVLGTTAHPHAGPAAFADIGRGMATYWRVLLAHHIAVVPIRESPEMGFDVPHCLATSTPAACSRPARSVVTPNPPNVIAARELGGRAPLVDLNPVICPHGVCRAVEGRIVVFRDVHHLTATYVASIAPKVRHALLATERFGAGVVQPYPGLVRPV
jgi:hypothetical protein